MVPPSRGMSAQSWSAVAARPAQPAISVAKEQQLEQRQQQVAAIAAELAATGTTLASISAAPPPPPSSLSHWPTPTSATKIQQAPNASPPLPSSSENARVATSAPLVLRGPKRLSALHSELAATIVTVPSAVVLYTTVAHFQALLAQSEQKFGPDAVSTFDSALLPAISLLAFVEHIMRNNLCSKECFIICTLYCQRLQQLHPEKILFTRRSLHRILLISALVASKILDDFYCRNVYYAQAGGLTKTDLNALEVKFCFHLDFDLNVSPNEFAAQSSAMLHSSWSSSPSASPSAVSLADPTGSTDSLSSHQQLQVRGAGMVGLSAHHQLAQQSNESIQASTQLLHGSVQHQHQHKHQYQQATTAAADFGLPPYYPPPSASLAEVELHLARTAAFSSMPPSCSASPHLDHSGSFAQASDTAVWTPPSADVASASFFAHPFASHAHPSSQTSLGQQNLHWQQQPQQQQQQQQWQPFNPRDSSLSKTLCESVSMISDASHQRQSSVEAPSLAMCDPHQPYLPHFQHFEAPPPQPPSSFALPMQVGRVAAEVKMPAHHYQQQQQQQRQQQQHQQYHQQYPHHYHQQPLQQQQALPLHHHPQQLPLWQAPMSYPSHHHAVSAMRHPDWLIARP